MDRQLLREHKLKNDLQQLGLLALLALLLGYLAWVVGGPPFAWGTLIGVALLYLVNPVASPRLVLGMYGARGLSRREVPRLYGILEELTERAGLERLPRLYYLPTRVMNAFATGRRQDAAIVLSDGLLRRLSLRELAGVLAHEVSHIANGDIQVMSFADTVSRITGLLGLLGQVLLVASIPLVLLGLETLPLGALLVLLASALKKLERYQGRFWEQMMLPGRSLPDPSLLRTHPPTEERVARLLDLVPARADTRLIGRTGREMLPPFERSPRTPPRWHVGGLWY